VPAVTPNVKPDEETLTLLLLLVHVPPNGDELSDTACPVHTVPGPAIAPGAGLTVATTLALHPVVEDANVTVTVPLVTPVSIPVEPIVAILVLLLVHTPLPAPALKALVPFGHTFSMPVITGSAFTVTVAVVKQPVV